MFETRESSLLKKIQYNEVYVAQAEAAVNCEKKLVLVEK